MGLDALRVGEFFPSCEFLCSLGSFLKLFYKLVAINTVILL